MKTPKEIYDQVTRNLKAYESGDLLGGDPYSPISRLTQPEAEGGVIEFVESCGTLTEYVDGKKIDHRFKGYTIPVIEYNELREAAKLWKGSTPPPEPKPVTKEVSEEIICCGTCQHMNDGECICADECTDFNQHYLSEGKTAEERYKKGVLSLNEETPPPEPKPVTKEVSEISDDEIKKMGMAAWEEDNKTNPNPVNPHAFLYGYKIAAKAIHKLVYGENTPKE